MHGAVEFAIDRQVGALVRIFRRELLVDVDAEPRLVSRMQLFSIPDLSTGSIPLPLNASTFTIPNPFHRGYIQSYNLMLQHEWRGLVLETGYVGAYDVRPTVNMNQNASAPGTGAAGGLLSQKFGKVYTGTINAYVPFKSSNYNSLQTKLTQRWKQGTMAGLSWTWSKSIDYASNEDLGSMRFPYPASWHKSRAVSDFDRTHNVKV